jgi:putative chitinase
MVAKRYTIGPNSLRHVWPSLTLRQARTWARVLGQAMHERGITSPQECAHFIAQCAYESGEGRWLREIWGPTPAQRGYGSRRDLQGSGRLGARIGWVYRGAGLIQTTGRINFRKAARALKVSVPRLVVVAGTKTYAARMAAVWWSQAFPLGTGDLTAPEVSARVNGTAPANGLHAREIYTRRAMEVRQYLTPRTTR